MTNTLYYMNENNKPALKINFLFLSAVFGVMLVSAAATAFLFIKANGIINKKMAETAETNRPANLDLTVITDQACKDCFDTNPILSQIKKENVKINSSQIDSASDAGKQLIAQFAIKKLPTFLVKGELAKNSVLAKFFSQAGDITDNTFVFRQVGGPYVDTATGKVSGRVNLVLLTDITCVECYDVTQHELILKQFGMQPVSKVLDIKSAAGAALINSYKIKLVPAFILTGDVNSYPDFKTVWPQVGLIANDGAYVFTKGVPFMGIYKDLATNKVITPTPAPAK